MEKFRYVPRKDIALYDDSKKLLLDVSSKSENYSIFSPFRKIGNIPHPCDTKLMCASVEDIWQGSKIFNTDNIKPDYFILFGKKSFMKNKGHKPLGTWLGGAKYTNDVAEARKKVYIPAYQWTLNNRLKNEVEFLLYDALKNKGTIYCLYDFDNNGDVNNPNPLSHASVLCDYLNSRYNDKNYMLKILRKFEFVRSKSNEY